MAIHADQNIKILNFEHNYHSDTPLHTHPYCQLEYCLGNAIPVFDGRKSRMLAPGTVWFIPPDTPHKFTGGPGQEFVSLKFYHSDHPGEIMIKDQVINFLMEEIRKIIDGELPFSSLSPEGVFLMENHLSGIISRFSGLPEQTDSGSFESKIFAAVCRSGAALSIDDLAGDFKMTRAQFKYAFFKQTGSKDIKGTICRYLIELAQKQLLYSDNPLFKVAEQLHFSSIYAFSRFFKKHCGISPLTFRKSQALTQTQKNG